jgi:iron complex outermembrane recepter protein
MLQAQELPFYTDTVQQEAVTVKGYETNRSLLTTPASIYVAGKKEINRFPNTSLVLVMNQAPGVRMEERSPGSYRLSVRGSLLRSPFGVRNIKVYFSGIPFTDAGGNSYINLPDVNMIESIEILKGPAGITYGAGTGGTVLLNELPGSVHNKSKTLINASLTGGSYKTFGEHIYYRQQNKNTGFTIQQSHFQSNGYREHSFLRRSNLMLQTHFQKKPTNDWHLFFLYGNLHYNTPGGITLEQMNVNPRWSRQRTVVLPSAIEQQAGVYQQTLFSGLSNKHIFKKNVIVNTSVFAAYTNFANPFITNYETRFEKSAGARSVVTYKNSNDKISITGGVETSVTGSLITNYGNRNGVKDTVQNKDDIRAAQGFAFVQVQVSFTPKLLLDAGLSTNHFRYRYERTYPVQAEGRSMFRVQWMPRVALLYRVTNRVSLYGSIGKGYSPPAIAEIRPDNQVLNTTLQPETGINHEAGLKGDFGRLFADITCYQFRLKDAIVRRTAASGDFFVNAGSTKQQGMELYAHAVLYQGKKAEQIKILTSIALNRYRFETYTVNTSVFDGNKITGVPGRVVTLGIDATLANGIYINTTGTYTAALPLTDDNSIFADSYYLVGCRTGYRLAHKGYAVDFFVSGNNLLNELYSSGNDLNAAGRRYYNPAAKRHFMGGIIVKR